MSIKRVGLPPLPARRYRRRQGVYAILPRGPSLLLTHQMEPEPEVQLPGGGIDAGEHPIAALHREVLEETGWHIGRPTKLGVFRRFTYMPEYDLWAEKLCHIYIARPSLRQGPPTEPGHSALWATPDVAARMVENPGDRMFIERAFGLTSRRS